MPPSDRQPFAANTSAKSPVPPRPSSSVVLVSPTNQILLLHRVRTSTSFASAHVFPGGNLDPFHDGTLPASHTHQDHHSYRLAAIRETFEESGILLAKNNGFGRLIEVPTQDREQGRAAVHKSEISFEKWLAGKGGRADVQGLIPCTRWITPTNVPKRFTTQMYIYFLPLPDSPTRAPGAHESALPGEHDTAAAGEGESLIPTPDGGVEHTAARFAPAEEWMKLQRERKVILFPPQMYLLSLVGQFLRPSEGMATAELGKQRQELREFLRLPTTPSWAEKVMSPAQIGMTKDKRSILGLDKPGVELKDSGRGGDEERVALVKFSKEGPRDVEIRWRKDVMEDLRGGKL